MKLPLLFIAALIAPCVSRAVAESEPPDILVAAEPAKVPGVPWHMINLNWRTKPIRDFSEFSIDVDISEDFPADKYNLYISPMNVLIGGNQAYGGFQTNVNGWASAHPDEHKRLHGGHGFIFSRWSETPNLSLKDVRAALGGFVETADYEGLFVSGRRPYAWTAGKHTFSLRKLDTEMIDGKPFSWVGCFVREHASNKEIFVSALRFPGKVLTYDGYNGAFLEFYGTEKNWSPPVVSGLPPLIVKYSDLRLNGAPAELLSVSTRFIRKAEKRPDGLRAPISPNLIRVKASEDGREVVCTLVNKPYEDSEEPDRVLWKKSGVK